MKIWMKKLQDENFLHEYKNDLVDRLLTEDNCILSIVTEISKNRKDDIIFLIEMKENSVYEHV